MNNVGGKFKIIKLIKTHTNFYNQIRFAYTKFTKYIVSIIISMLYFPHYFPFFISIFSSFLFLFVLWWYYTRSGTIKRLRIRKCIKRNWDTIIHSKCFIFSKIRSDEAHYPTTNFISSTLLRWAIWMTPFKKMRVMRPEYAFITENVHCVIFVQVI